MATLAVGTTIASAGEGSGSIRTSAGATVATSTAAAPSAAPARVADGVQASSAAGTHNQNACPPPASATAPPVKKAMPTTSVGP